MSTRRLARVPPPADELAPPSDADEAGSLAQEMARAYREAATFYRDLAKATPADADAQARASFTPADQERVAAKPADQVGWWDISRLAESDPDAAATLWRRVRRQARSELASGHRAAKALQTVGGTPWDRARFLAVRASLHEEHDPPPSGAERLLLDSAARAYTMLEEWTELLHQRWYSAYTRERSQIERANAYELPQVSHAVAMEEAAHMVERHHRMFLQTVRQLQAMRRPSDPPAVLVQTVRQLTITDQQVNLTWHDHDSM